MKLWSRLSDFWKGFILGGITVPLVIVIIEVVIRVVLLGEIVWN